MTVFVLDNSVVMRWFFDEGAHPFADGVLHRLKSVTDDAVVPMLWPYEVSAVLAREQSRGLATAQDVDQFINALRALPIAIDESSAARIFSSVHLLAVSNRLTTYDASYLELAVRRQAPLATLDAELIAACRKMGVALLEP